MVILESVSKVFRQGREEVPALSDVSLRIEKGECVTIKGPSGCGKSTLLGIIGTLARPTRGEVSLDGTRVTGLPEHFLCDLRRRKIGFVFQHFHLLRGYSALENVGLPLVPQGLREAERNRRAMPLLEAMGLESRAHFPIHHLSGGEQQRVAIARALVLSPELLIADEPISNVDADNAALIGNVLANLNREGKTLIFTTHIEPTGALTPTSTYTLAGGRLT